MVKLKLKKKKQVIQKSHYRIVTDINRTQSRIQNLVKDLEWIV